MKYSVLLAGFILMAATTAFSEVEQYIGIATDEEGRVVYREKHRVIRENKQVKFTVTIY